MDDKGEKIKIAWKDKYALYGKQTIIFALCGEEKQEYRGTPWIVECRALGKGGMAFVTWR